MGKRVHGYRVQFRSGPNENWETLGQEFPDPAKAQRWCRENGEQPPHQYQVIAICREPFEIGLEVKEVRTVTPVA